MNADEFKKRDSVREACDFGSAFCCLGCDIAPVEHPEGTRFNGVKIGGCLLRNKKKWVYSCYDKLACDLFFDPQITQTRLPLQGTSGQVTRIRKI